MKPLAERNPAIIGAIGVGITAGVVLAALQYDKLPFYPNGHQYAAFFADASGLPAGADVQVAGYRVGTVSSVDLEGSRVLVEFNVDTDVHIGDRSEAAVKTESLLGVKVLEVASRGEQQLSEPIPLQRTRPAYQLPDALGDLTTIVADLNTKDLNASLSVMAQEFSDTPPEFKDAIAGVARFSQTLNERDKALRRLLSNARKSVQVFANRSDQIAGLIANANALMTQLQTESVALDDISTNISELAHQLSGFIGDNRAQLRPALDKLNGVLALMDNRKGEIQESIKLLHPYWMAFGETVSSGPFLKFYVANLLPGQFLQPFIDAAFSDLGLDPNVLPPSQRDDPQTGQPGTPALPVPYPRTGQGGEPHLTLPDAITGKPGDPRYPFREPLPAPPPGGPPPGPPAVPRPTEPSDAESPAPGQPSPREPGQ